MSKTYDAPFRPVVAQTITKLRENSADSILYVSPDHTVALPQTVTIQSELPNPRKGNPGTVKTSINVRVSVTLDAGAATERVVPVIAKLQTSFPVGCTKDDRNKAFDRLTAMILADSDNLFYDGLLPE